MAGEVLWRVRGALGADVELAGRAAAPRRAPFPEDKWKTSEITRYILRRSSRAARVKCNTR